MEAVPDAAQFDALHERTAADALVGGGGLAVEAVGVDAGKTTTPCQARRATSVAGTPELSHRNTSACRGWSNLGWGMRVARQR
jgi:hypothetical protein